MDGATLAFSIFSLLKCPAYELGTRVMNDKYRAHILQLLTKPEGTWLSPQEFSGTVTLPSLNRFYNFLFFCKKKKKGKKMISLTTGSWLHRTSFRWPTVIYSWWPYCDVKPSAGRSAMWPPAVSCSCTADDPWCHPIRHFLFSVCFSWWPWYRWALDAVDIDVVRQSPTLSALYWSRPYSHSWPSCDERHYGGRRKWKTQEHDYFCK